MKLISIRQNFIDSDHLASKLQFWNIAFSEDVADKKIDVAEFESSIENQTVLLLIHGYNNEHDEILDAYEIIEKNIKQSLHAQYDEVIGFSWPGGSDKLNYYNAKGRANSVARRFRSLLNKMEKRHCTVDIMAHSMGNRVVLKAIKDSSKKTVRNIFSLAAAVDNECLEPGEEFFDSAKNYQRIFVFHSKKDPVLKCAYRLAEFDRALGYSGPEDVNYCIKDHVPTWVINCKRVIKSHGGYKRSTSLYQYIDHCLTTLDDNRKIPKYITME